MKVSKQLEKKQRAKQQDRMNTGEPSSSSSSGKQVASDKPPVLPKTDAVLNCPACMCTLSLDCQRQVYWFLLVDIVIYLCRHDVYANQYRAMFVLNCRVIRDEVLKYVPKPSKSARKRQRRSKTVETSEASSSVIEDSKDIYHPVHCDSCNTEVAVVDEDEVFHFFNVLASAPS